MPRTKLFAAAATAAFLAAVPLAVAAGGGNKGGSDAIWIMSPTAAAPTASSTLRYGQTFSAGYSSKSSYLWAHAQCFTASGTMFWDEWRATQADGSIGVFDLTTNTNQTWPSGSVSCTLDLVNLQPKASVLATTTFAVGS